MVVEQALEPGQSVYRRGEKFLPEGPVPVLLSGSAGQDKVAALLYVFRPSVDKGAVQKLVCRGDQERILVEIRLLGNDIHRAGHLLQEPVVFLGVVESLPLRSLLLVLNLPVDWHFVENGSTPCRTAFRLPGLRVVCLTEKFQFFVDLNVLLSARGKGDAVGEHHSIVVLLAAPQRLAETVVAYEFAASCEYMVNPHPHCARHRLRVECAPVDLSRL